MFAEVGIGPPELSSGSAAADSGPPECDWALIRNSTSDNSQPGRDCDHDNPTTTRWDVIPPPASGDSVRPVFRYSTGPSSSVVLATQAGSQALRRPAR